MKSWDGCRTVWHLGEAGYQILNQRYPEKFKSGFRSENKDHDFWVTSTHLGEWVARIPANCDVFTERELRSNEVKEYSKWVPQTRTHQPDGYWKIGSGQPNGKSLISLEVELSKKNSNWYKDVNDFYSNVIEIKQVIWVTKTETDAKYISRHLGIGEKVPSSLHSFTTLEQYSQHQWQSQIIFGKDQGKTLSWCLRTSPEPDLNPYSAPFF